MTILVIGLLIAGTSYDFYLQYLREKRNVRALTCNSYGNGNGNLVENAIKLNMSVPDMKSYNGTN